MLCTEGTPKYGNIFILILPAEIDLTGINGKKPLCYVKTGFLILSFIFLFLNSSIYFL